MQYEELSARALARRTGRSPKTIQGWVDAGLPCYRTGRTLTFIWAEYVAWLRSKRVRPTSSHAEKRAGELLNAPSADARRVAAHLKKETARGTDAPSRS